MLEAKASTLMLEEKLEDGTNWQLRQMIVVKGLAEKENEKRSDTRQILAKHVSKAYQINIKKPTPYLRETSEEEVSKKKGKRDI